MRPPLYHWLFVTRLFGDVQGRQRLVENRDFARLPQINTSAGSRSTRADNSLSVAHTTHTMLDPSADEMRDWGNSVIQFMTEYLGDLRDRGVYRRMFSRAIRNRLDSTLPISGTDFEELLKVFREAIVPFSRQNAHPRMFG